MSNLKDIKSEISQVNSLNELTQVYGEIASTRMKKIRGYVLKNREFLDAIESIFRDTLKAFSQQLAERIKQGKMQKGENVTFLAHNGKTVAAVITANTGFFGEVVKDTFRKFVSDIKDKNIEVTVIGKVGKGLFTSAFPNRPFAYFELPDYGIDKEKLEEVIRHLVQYGEIRLYYGKFISVVTQKPETRSITAGTSVQNSSDETVTDYIFEPSIEDVLMFFETQIFASLFDQTLRESQLAKFASRIIAMDRASQNIEKKVKDLNLEKLSLAHKLANTKQLNSMGPVVYQS
jgi:F-type H+-transporting ATPase subunit gamma